MLTYQNPGGRIIQQALNSSRSPHSEHLKPLSHGQVRVWYQARRQDPENMALLKIDTHQHVMPPAVKKAIEKNPGLAQGMKAPDWVLEKTLEFMASNNIGTSILSCPFPLTVVCQDAAETAALAREANEYLASIRDRHPTQFGFFATLPSAEDTARCIDEIRYALDMLKADGVVLFTSYNDKYLGHPNFEPVWRELDSRAAVVFTHPTMEDIKKSIDEPFTIPRVLMDWSHETTRTAVHLILTNTIRRCAGNCRIILSHGGGTLPFVAGRIADMGLQTHLSGKSADEFLADARLFYFDLALVGHAMPLQLVMDFASDGHVLYGTDYPAVKGEDVAEQWMAVGDKPLIAATRMAAQTLFPRLAD
ncbi:amidohydrolase family protein [Aspergillus foveolatus]|uniref:amidohydrolase family protein n=1 Tax=Aspergillus foveolatus TaxID=210207 RepID=UPI003CCD21C5